MVVGLIGAGSMAGALARGWAAAETGPDEILITDSGSGRALSLAEELGLRACDSNCELAESSDLVVLCMKPGGLHRVAEEIRVTVAERALPLASVLGATSLARIEQAFGPGTPVMRFIPNVAAEVRLGTLCYAPGGSLDKGLERDVLDLFGLLGEIVPLDERVMDAATALAGCAPAFLALVVEALVDAGVRQGLKAPEAANLVIGAMAGTAELLRRRRGDTVSLRRQVASPGGTTAAGLAALEERGLRPALAAAVDAVVRTARAAEAKAQGRGSTG